VYFENICRGNWATQMFQFLPKEKSLGTSVLVSFHSKHLTKRGQFCSCTTHESDYAVVIERITEGWWSNGPFKVYTSEGADPQVRHRKPLVLGIASDVAAEREPAMDMVRRGWGSTGARLDDCWTGEMAWMNATDVWATHLDFDPFVNLVRSWWIWCLARSVNRVWARL
jgi:hypothetical protein